jgi:glutamine---fructose-6-phosphate transaminase (isomerizing)
MYIVPAKSRCWFVGARGGERIRTNRDHYHSLTLADICPGTAPIVYTIPLQLLAYHTAVLKGTGLGQARNLAKSVTVE